MERIDNPSKLSFIQAEANRFRESIDKTGAKALLFLAAASTVLSPTMVRAQELYIPDPVAQGDWTVSQGLVNVTVFCARPGQRVDMNFIDNYNVSVNGSDPIPYNGNILVAVNVGSESPSYAWAEAIPGSRSAIVIDPETSVGPVVTRRISIPYPTTGVVEKAAQVCR